MPLEASSVIGALGGISELAKEALRQAERRRRMTLEQLDYWHWWILAAALIILEVFAPGAFFLWLGMAAGAVGGMVYLAPNHGAGNSRCCCFRCCRLSASLSGGSSSDKTPQIPTNRP